MIFNNITRKISLKIFRRLPCFLVSPLDFYKYLNYNNSCYELVFMGGVSINSSNIVMTTADFYLFLCREQKIKNISKGEPNYE